MHFFISIALLLASTELMGVEKSPKKATDLEVAYTHTVLFEKAASDLRVRQLQKLVKDENWARKTAEIKKGSQSR